RDRRWSGDLRSRVRQRLALRFARTGTAKRRLANRARESARGNAGRRRYRCFPVRVALTHFRRRTILVQLSRERHDHFLCSAELENSSIVGERKRNQSGSKFGNISSASASALNGTQSQIAKNFSHIASTFGFLCAASIASCDFHSETSIIVPSRARIMIGARSVTSPSLRKVGMRLRTSSRSSVSFSGFGR